MRVIEIVDEENAVLQEQRVISHAGFTDRKSHALRELMIVQRAESSPTVLASSRTSIERLSAALKVNSVLLKLHIAAVVEISDIIIAGLHEAESDGTYTRTRSARWT